MKQRILFSALGGSLFPTLKFFLDSDYEIFFHDKNEKLSYEYPEYNFRPSPEISSEEYIPFLKDYIISKKINVYVPLIDEELIKVKETIEGFKGVKVISPSLNFIKSTLDKFKLMKSLKRDNISKIETFNFENLEKLKNYPYIIKPIFGRGSRGIQIVSNIDEIKYHLKKQKSEELIQEYISGVEYTVGVNVNSLNQILSISSRMIIVKRGITIEAKTIRNKQINSIVKSIVKKMEPCGPFNLQLIIDSHNNIKVFEINPRFSTTLILSYYSGINEIKTYLGYYDKKFKSKFEESRSNIYLKRRWENIFYEV